MTEYQVTMKQMQSLRFFYFNDDFQNGTWEIVTERKQSRNIHQYSTNRLLNRTRKVLAMFTVYINDRVSNYYEANANF